MKNYFRLLQISIITLVLLLVACGEDSSPIIMQTSQNFIEVVEDELDLPECTEDNVGEQYIVQGESFSRICIGGKWSTGTNAGKDTVYLKNKTVSCVTKELLDHSGVKIVCDGDSVGVLLNGNQGKTGEKGEKGIDGAGCSLVRVSETSVRLFCGGDSTTVYLGVPPDTTAKDSVVEPYAAKEDSTKGCTLVRMDSLSVRLFCDGDSITLYEHALPDTATEVPVKEDSTKNCKLERIDSLSVRLVCDGDSIVLYEHALPDTAVNDASKSCTMERIDSLAVRLVCDGDSITLYEHALPDTGTVVTPPDSITGYAQKGPLVEGSVINIWEITNEQTLKHDENTGEQVTTDNKGRFVFSPKDIGSRYVRLSGKGAFYNEVTGSLSDENFAKIAAIVDVEKQRTANMNLLTYWTTYRVSHLVNGQHISIDQAKEMAHEEILSHFHIDDAAIFSAFEDMNIFGTSESDAALLAISILVMRDLTTREIVRTYHDVIASDFTDGSWDSDSMKAVIADWAMDADLGGRLPKIRQNILGWGISETVPDFEKYIRNFWVREYNVPECSASNDDETITIINANGVIHSLTCTTGEWTLNVVRDARDSHVYRVVKIGSQVWMAENLNYETEKSYCYNDSSEYCDKYGRLYTWAASMDSAAVFSDDGKNCGYGTTCTPLEPVRGICPEGWHLPSIGEWKTLIATVGEPSARRLLSREQWKSGWNGIDSVLFTVLPSGYKSGDGEYKYMGERVVFGSSSEIDLACIFQVHIYDSVKNVSIFNRGIDARTKPMALPVRCLKD